MPEQQLGRDATYRGGGAIARADRLAQYARHALGLRPPAPTLSSYVIDLHQNIKVMQKNDSQSDSHLALM